MPGQTTEHIHPQAADLDLASDAAVLSILHASQVEAAKVVKTAIPALAKGAEAMANAIRSGGNLVYAAAGSSGLMGLADGLEIPPTYGIPESRITILRAGGLADLERPTGEAEDDAQDAAKGASAITGADCVICLAASGNTPYTARILDIAKARGAATIGISNNPGTRLLSAADIPILLPTAPEVIAGSTRLGAGTAQKIALNMMSTLMGVRLGHVYDGLMVNLVANNTKLAARAENIVMSITGCVQTEAASNLKTARGGVKEAILLNQGATSLDQARMLLNDADQNLRTALANLSPRSPTSGT